MADAESNTNVTPIRPADPTNAERQRRHRAKQRKRSTAAPRPTPTVTARNIEAGKLASLKVEKAAVDGERKAVEADFWPVRYLATLIGASDDATTRGFVLIVALLLDPAAVGANSQKKGGNRQVALRKRRHD